MDSPTEVQDKSVLVERIRSRYVALAGHAIPVDLNKRMKAIPFSDMLELIIEIGSLDQNKLPMGGVAVVIEAKIEEVGLRKWIGRFGPAKEKSKKPVQSVSDPKAGLEDRRNEVVLRIPELAVRLHHQLKS